jgi:hypothetical protein
MILEDRLYDIERLFWTGGSDIYRTHVDETCLTVFAEMAALLDRERIAQSAGAAPWSAPATSAAARTGR